MTKIQMKTPIVEIDGDEMTRILWEQIKDKLILPFVDLKSEYYDLGLVNREKTNDQVTVDCAEAIKKYGVGVKCATITPNAQRVEEYNLKEMWKSPNGTIRGILGGTVFRAPILCKNIKSYVPGWTSPIVMARHAYGDIYNCEENEVGAGTKAELVFTKDGKEKRQLIKDFQNAGGVVRGMHNDASSIEQFAHACFMYSLENKVDLWFGSKDTISKIYHHKFKDVFQDIYDKHYKMKFEALGIEYFYTLIDDIVARIIKSNGGMLWACMNYDGDVMSDLVATAFGSLAMMSSVLISPDGYYEYEAAHGTVTRHYYRHLEGQETSTNPVATIYAWTGALNKRGEMDEIPELCEFAKNLEKATLDTIESGVMTGDLLALAVGETKKVNSKEFMDAIASSLS